MGRYFGRLHLSGQGGVEREVEFPQGDVHDHAHHEHERGENHVGGSETVPFCMA